MKKTFLPVLMALVVSGFTAAQARDEENGLTVGLGVDFGNAKDQPAISVTPQISYENSIGPASLFFELDYTILLLDLSFIQDEASTSSTVERFSQDLYLEEEVAYNFSPRPSSLLTFTLNNKNKFFIYPNPVDFTDRIAGIIDPHITFTQDIRSSEFYGTAGFPVAYTDYAENSDHWISTYLTLGYRSFFDSAGMGVLHYGIALTGDLDLYLRTGYRGMSGLIFCEREDSFRLELECHTDNDRKVLSRPLSTGMDHKMYCLLPAFEGHLPTRIGKFIVRLEAEFGNLGTTDIVIVPAFWIKLRF